MPTYKRDPRDVVYEDRLYPFTESLQVDTTVSTDSVFFSIRNGDEASSNIMLNAQQVKALRRQLKKWLLVNPE